MRAFGVMIGFVGFAAAWAAVEAGAGAGGAAYPGFVAEEIGEPELWLLDGFNVLHVGVLRGRERGAWWGGEARARLLERVARFDAGGERVWIVFDGSRAIDPTPAGPAGPRVVFSAPADEWLLERLRETADPSRVAVVTADRRLAARARRRGARVVAPGAFLARCETP